MTQEIPTFQTFYFHPNLVDKEHRDKCPSCQFVIAGMTMFVDIVKDQEKRTYDE